jgi:hypothetical protein
MLRRGTPTDRMNPKDDSQEAKAKQAARKKKGNRAMKKPSGIYLGIYVVCALLIGVGVYVIVWPSSGGVGYGSALYARGGSGTIPLSKDQMRGVGVLAVLIGSGLLYLASGAKERR